MVCTVRLKHPCQFWQVHLPADIRLMAAKILNEILQGFGQTQVLQVSRIQIIIQAPHLIDYVADIFQLFLEQVFDIFLLRRQFPGNGPQGKFQGQQGMTQFVM